MKNLENKIKLDEDLAEFIGIFIGDGSLYVRKHKHSYEFKFTGNPKDEFPYYAYVSKLASKILDRSITVKSLDCGKTVGLYFCSKKFFRYLNSIGMKSGPKSKTIKIPTNILKSKTLVIACLRGIFDTDGCLTIKKRGRNKPYYPVVTFGMASRNLIEQISELLFNFDIPHSKSFDVSYFDTRTFKIYKKHFLSINGKNNIDLWFNRIGTNNPKNKEKYIVIKKK